MNTAIISTKEIRNDLEGFLKRLKHGQKIQVLYRSKPLVTLMAQEEHDAYLSENAGTHTAAVHSVNFIKSLPYRKPVFDVNKSFKELYKDTQTL
jgi:antitoxin (DNA-binding transcriptional repressor) of toxin-antitoxin stability system